MEPKFGWILLSRDALRKAETHLNDQVQGVRDEIGFLALHQAYADRFFPGTSVQHTRLRYVMFVPWIYMRLIEKGADGSLEKAIESAEIEITGRLKRAEQNGIIGIRNHPQPTSQPPCLVYWSAIGNWRILKPIGDGTYPSRSEIHRILKKRKSGGRMRDDDKQLLEEQADLFASVPSPPKDWNDRNAKLDFTLTKPEKDYLKNVLLALTRPSKNSPPAPALISRLVESNATPDEHTDMWSQFVFDAADDSDREALIRSQQVAKLSAIGRAVYAALVETTREKHDDVPTENIHRENLVVTIEKYRRDALALDIAAVEQDSTRNLSKILDLLFKTQKWLRAGAKDIGDLFQVYEEAEFSRKGDRARLAKSIKGREKRSEWLPENHAMARQLHYRWQNARRFLLDLEGQQ